MGQPEPQEDESLLEGVEMEWEVLGCQKVLLFVVFLDCPTHGYCVQFAAVQF